MTIKQEREAEAKSFQQIQKLVDRMGEEAYYGMNLKFVLADALRDRRISHMDVSTMLNLMDQALAERTK